LTTIFAIDIGTTKLCALALQVESLEPLAVYSIPNGADVAGLPEGFHEQVPVRLWDRVLDLLGQLLSDKAVRREEVAAIGITGQMHGVLLVDAGLRPTTNLITWRDQRVLQADMPGCLDEARRAVGLDAAKRTGCRLHAGYGGATLYHLAQNGGLPQDCTALTIADYIAACLTGVAATEPTHAASWGLLDLKSRQWDSEMVRCLGLPPAILPTIRPTSTALAPIRGELAKLLGLPSNARVHSPIGDNQASIIGAAGLAPDVAVVNLGTGGQVSIPQPDPVWIESFETRPMPFGGYVLVGASLCGGWSYAYLKKFFQETAREFAGVELADTAAYDRMNRLAAAAPAGAEGLVVRPLFNGTRTDPNLRGAVSAMNTANFTPGNLARAFLEGIVRELADLFHAADVAHIAKIAASGNAVRKNGLVAAMIETLFGRKCIMSRHDEEAALGAAYAAALAVSPGLLPALAEQWTAHSFLAASSANNAPPP